MSAELKKLTHDVQELAGMPVGSRDGVWGVVTARAVLKKFFSLGLSLEQAGVAPQPPGTSTGAGKVDDRSEGNIATLHAKLQPLARALISQAAERGMIFKITSGSRTYEEQAELRRKYEAGGPKAARAGYSNHNFQLAFDVTEFNGAAPVWESPNYRKVGTIGKELGLSWGGDWTGGDQDEPHFELRPPFAKNMGEAQMIAELRRRHAAEIDPFT